MVYNIQPKSEDRGSLSLINPEQEGPGFISGKLPMTVDKSCMFIDYNVVAVIDMIYAMGMSY